MNQNYIETLFKIKTMLFATQIVLFILLLLTIIINVFMFRKKIKIIFPILLITLFFLIPYNLKAEDIELTKEIETEDKFLGLFPNKLKISTYVEINPKTNLIEKVIFFDFKSNDLFGNNIKEGSYQVLDSGKSIHVALKEINGNAHSIILEAPSNSQQTSQSVQEFPRVDLKDKITMITTNEVNTLSNNILVLLSLIIFSVAISFIQLIIKPKQAPIR